MKKNSNKCISCCLIIGLLIFGMVGCGFNNGSINENITESSERSTSNISSMEAENSENYEASIPNEVEEDKAETEESNPDVQEQRPEKVDREDIEKALLEWKEKGDNDFYLIPEGNIRKLDREELIDSNSEELRLMRNEIAARHGWDFEDLVLGSYFSSQKWYTLDKTCNDSVQYNEVEMENIELIRELENEKSKSSDYHRLERLTELEYGSVYEFQFGNCQITLSPEDEGYLSISENERIFTNSYYQNCEKAKILIYNKNDESYLIISGMHGENDITLSDIYLLNQEGITYVDNFSGYIVSYISNGFCRYYEGIAIDVYNGYEWLFLQDDKWIPKGKAKAKAEYKVIKEFNCYAVEQSGFEEIAVYPGEKLKLVSVDHRQNDVEWIELEREDRLVLLPYFIEYKGYTGICADGCFPWDYFEVSRYVRGW